MFYYKLYQTVNFIIIHACHGERKKKHPTSPLSVTYLPINFQPHIENNTVKVCNYYIRDIHHVRKHITLDASTALANALVSSRLDYCNCLLHFLPGVHLNKLQRVQYALASIISTPGK